MKTKIFAALLLAAPFLAHAQPPAAVDQPCMAKMGHHPQHDGHGFGNHEATPPFLRGIALSDAQKDKVFDLMHKQAPLMREKEKLAFLAMGELRQSAFSDRYDEARVKSLAQSAANAQSEIALLRAQTDQKIYALLTPEQRSEVAAKIAGKAKT